MDSECDWRQVKSPAGSKPRKMFLPRDMSENAGRIVAFHYARRNNPEKRVSHENSWPEMCLRLAEAWKEEAVHSGIFGNSRKLAAIFQDEITWMLFHRMASPNSPQWFNTGTAKKYGFTEPEFSTSLHYAFCAETSENTEFHEEGEVYETRSPRKPMASACFILLLLDNLSDRNGIMDLFLRESKIFQSGGGAGSNFSAVRADGEPLSGGGTSSGLVSFLRVGDTSAGALKSGGNSRRAAKMIVIDADHPEIEDIVDWKPREEAKLEALLAGDALLRKSVTDKGTQLRLSKLAPFTRDWRDESVRTVQGQNANMSVRITDLFLTKAKSGNLDANDIDLEKETPQDWALYRRTDGKIAKKISAKGLWLRICEASWLCADPGIQYEDTIQAWNPCDWRKNQELRIKATNPCAEFVYLDNSACNLASLHLGKYKSEEDLSHAAMLWTLVLETTVRMASYPSVEIAANSRDHRPLGLGIANLGGLLMTQGISYDSKEGRDIAHRQMSIIQASAILASAQIAEVLGPCNAWKENKHTAEKVLKLHAAGISAPSHELDSEAPIFYARDPFLGKLWKTALASAKKHGLRNMQLTAIAPTGTIALQMDCATTGIEPELALVKTKILADGGEMTFVNPAIEDGLQALNYDPETILKISGYLTTHNGIQDCPHLKDEHKSVFLCAFPSRKDEPVLTPEAHILMLGAVQPSISGTASKTVNLPHTATIEDISKTYLHAWKLGLKCISVYRDGSKGTQPLQVMDKPEETQSTDPTVVFSALSLDNQRIKLPWKRPGTTYRVKIGGHKVFMRTGEYPDGSLGEIFLDTHREGATLRGFFDAFGILASQSLQFRMPLEAMVNCLEGMRFEPSGFVVGDPDIKSASSIPDWMARRLGIDYLGMHHLATPQENKKNPALEDDFTTVAEKSSEPKQKFTGYSGELCTNCGSTSVRRTGSCLFCDTCQQSSGGCG